MTDQKKHFSKLPFNPDFLSERTPSGHKLDVRSELNQIVLKTFKVDFDMRSPGLSWGPFRPVCSVVHIKKERLTIFWRV